MDPAAYLHARLETSADTKQLSLFDMKMQAVAGSTKKSESQVSKWSKEVDKSRRPVDSLSGSLGNLNLGFLTLRNVTKLFKVPVILSLATPLAQGVNALAAGVVGLAGALLPAAGAAATAANAIGAFAQVAGVAALAGISDVTAAVGGLNEKLDTSADAFKNLSPQAQQFAVALDKAKKPVLAIQRSVQKPLFEGLEKSLGGFLKFAGGPLQSVLTGTARRMGALAQRASEFVSRKGFGRDFEKIGKTNNELLSRMGRAGLNLADAFRHVMVEARPLTEWIGKMAVQFSKYIRDSARAGRNSGDLADFFEETKQLLRILGPMLADFGKGLWNVMRAGAGLGTGLLKDLRDSADTFREWTESAKGQNAIKKWFDDAARPIREMARLIRDVGEAFFDLGRGNKGATSLIKTLRKDMLPIIVDILKSSEDFLPVFLDFAREATKALEPFVGPTGPMAILMKTATLILRAFNKLIEAVPELGSVLATLASSYAVSRLLGLGRLFGGGKGGKGGGPGGLPFLPLGLPSFGKGAPTKPVPMPSRLPPGSSIPTPVGGRAGSALGSILGKVGPIAGKLGVAGVGISLANEVWKGFETESMKDSKNAITRVMGHLEGLPKEGFLDDVMTLGGGSDAARDRTRLEEIVQVVSKLQRKGEELSDSGFKAFMQEIRGMALPPDTMKALRDMFKLVGQGPDTQKAKKELRNYKDELRNTFKIGGLGRQFKSDLAEIDANWGKSSKKGKELSKEVTDALVKRVDTMVDQNRISWKKGEEFLNRHGRSLKELEAKYKPLSSTAIQSFKKTTDKSGDMSRKVGNNYAEFSRVANAAMSQLGKNTNRALSALNAKNVKFGFGPVTQSQKQAFAGARQKGGPIPVPGTGVGDKVPMMLGGQYVADVEPGELVNVTNRDAAKKWTALNNQYPRFGRFQRGGAFGTREDVLGSGPGFVPYMNYLNSMFGPLNVISGARPGSITTSGNVSNHSWGGAVDISTPGGEGATAGNPMAGAMGARMDAAHRWIASKFAPINLDLLWRTMVGGNHYNHIHSGIARSHSFNAEAMSDFISRLPHGAGFSALKRIMISGPDGALKDMAQGAADKVWKAAKAHIAKQSMVPTFGASSARIDPHGRGGTFTSTAYGPPWGGINGMGVTATGVDLRGSPHTFGIATDPSVIPLGTKVSAWPNPHRHRGAFTAFDTGGAIQGKRIDFYDWSNPMAWGVKQTQVQGFQKGTGRDKGGKRKDLDERKPKKYARLIGDARKAMRKARQKLGRTDERLSLAQTYAASEISPGGAELTAKERSKQLKLLERQFDLLRTVRHVARMGVKIQKRAGKPGGVWRDALVEMEGLTGQGGRLFENRLMYRELKRTGLAGQTGLSIDQLVSLREAFDRGIFPSFGDGGIFKAPAGQTSGLAELHDGERVVPEGGGDTVIYSDVYIGDGPARQLIAKGVRHEIKEVQIETARSAATGRLPK